MVFNAYMSIRDNLVVDLRATEPPSHSWFSSRKLFGKKCYFSLVP